MQARLHSVVVPAEQIASFTKHEGMVAVENHPCEIAGLTIANRVNFPAFTTVLAHEKGSVAAAGPGASVAAVAAAAATPPPPPPAEGGVKKSKSERRSASGSTHQ